MAAAPGDRGPTALLGVRTDEGLAGDMSRLKRTVGVASLSTFCLGYNTGIIAGALLAIEKDPLFGSLNGSDRGLVVSCALAGATLGALCGSVADCLGRRATLLSVAIIFVLAPLAMALAPSLGFLVLARAMAGVGVGISSSLTNLYISEVAPAECRGRLGGWAPFLGTTGILTSYASSAVLEAILPVAGWSASWRWQLGLAVLPALSQLLLQGSLPETPSWLMSRGRRESARASLMALFPSAGSELVEAELDCIEAELQASQARGKVGIFALCSQHRLPSQIGVAINVLQQVSGINVVIYFGPTILHTAGFGDTGAMVVTALVTVIQLVMTAVLVKYVDRIGRRPLALLGIQLMVGGLGMLIASFLGEVAAGGTTLWAAWLAVGGMLVYRAAFSLSLGPLPYIMTSEFFPQEARAAGVAVSWASNWGANFVVSLTFPLAVDALPGSGGIAGIFGVYVCFCIGAYAFVRSMLPETAGLRLEVASPRSVSVVGQQEQGARHGAGA